MKAVRARHGKMCCNLADHAHSVGARRIDFVWWQPEAFIHFENLSCYYNRFSCRTGISPNTVLAPCSVTSSVSCLELSLHRSSSWDWVYCSASFFGWPDNWESFFFLPDETTGNQFFFGWRDNWELIFLADETTGNQFFWLTRQLGIDFFWLTRQLGINFFWLTRQLGINFFGWRDNWESIFLADETTGNQFFFQAGHPRCVINN